MPQKSEDVASLSSGFRANAVAYVLLMGGPLYVLFVSLKNYLAVAVKGRAKNQLSASLLPDWEVAARRSGGQQWQITELCAVVSSSKKQGY